MYRIHHPSKRSSHLSLWLGLLAAVGVMAGFLHYSSIQAEKKKAGNYNYLKSVPSNSVLKSTLTEDQYRVTRQNGTETAFRNEYWDNNRPGIYADVITNDPLFSSLDKFDGGTGRPTFRPSSAIRTSVTSSRIRPRPPASVTLSTPPRCVLSRWKKWKPRVTPNISTRSEKKSDLSLNFWFHW